MRWACVLVAAASLLACSSPRYELIAESERDIVWRLDNRTGEFCAFAATEEGVLPLGCRRPPRK
jgi:hypothetical protein